ncbi:phosphoribosylamine--glycine ligase [Bernardetia litoralis DSM 6794]|uniref:Phosphoribosylamine--glycine ligase n=1 Tax=Bernardetia litoralis (strain ATCC 23117 / DSM 6794 / NBRC 15988 / NCIMB 1366 / Fx l1 / Sio-4) TaxID=880071 RepID=I4AM55_BERLS|nr:phosphoribosylamine--glycine ligase [Bernardetia litoralis]AFM05040.1 phosphoribosylamine--glycine ligase [Bernardetia litoralis DSM 6794]
MNVLIIGSGGREHAFAWKIAQSSLCDNLYIATGNAGTAQVGTNVAIKPTDFERLGQFCMDSDIDLVLVGNEEPLVKGIVDYFKNDNSLKNIKIIGANKQGAQLEGSKDFAKNFMVKNNIPTAKSETFTKESIQKAKEYAETLSLPVVLKADGLAAGKGVVIAHTKEETNKTLDEMLLDEKFGEASSKVVIEEFLDGIEVSIFVLTDGKDYVLLPEAKDYKQIGEGNTGLNTGGMGAVSPVPFVTEQFIKDAEENIVKPTLQGLQNENIDYCGFIFIGLMVVKEKAFVLEYNVRMGDPETEVVLPRIESDFLALLDATAKKELGQHSIKVSKKAATTIMLVSGGYPEAYQTGKLIKGHGNLPENVIAFHAGTKEDDSQTYTNGGRVIALTALADTAPEALAASNHAADLVNFEGKYYRKDIGKDLF